MAYVLGAAIIAAAGVGLFMSNPKEPQADAPGVVAENSDPALPPGHPPTNMGDQPSGALPPGHPAPGDDPNAMPPGHPQVGSATDLPPGHPADPVGKPAQGDPAKNVSGEVLETIHVSSYTYVRLKTDQGEVWAAVGKVELEKGKHVEIQRVTLMHDFSSPSLGRTFKEIYFGNLAPAEPRGDKAGASPKTPL